MHHETSGGLSLVGPGELLMKVRSPPRNAWKGIQGDLPGATCTSWARALGRLGPALCTLTFLSLESFSQESFCPADGTVMGGFGSGHLARGNYKHTVKGDTPPTQTLLF